MPAQHGWFAVFYNPDVEAGERRWAVPLIAWKIHDEEDSAEHSSYICGSGITVPSSEGDDECDNCLESYQWLPELYSKPPIFGENCTHPHWRLPD